MKRFFLAVAIVLSACVAGGVHANAGFFMLAQGPALQISGTPVTTGSINVAITNWTATATGGKTPYVYSDKNGALPTGVTVNSSTGVVGGTPTVAGTYPNIVVEVTDNAGSTADLAAYTLAITPGGVPTLVPGAAWNGTTEIAPPPQPGGRTTVGCDLNSQQGSASILDQCPAGAFDTWPNIVVEQATSPMSITVGAAVADRAWINKVVCYLEGNQITMTTQTKNPTTGSGGWTFKVSSAGGSAANGVGTIYCDIYPVNGLTRRLGLPIWINDNPGGSHYTDRSTLVRYVDWLNGSDSNTGLNFGAGHGSAGPWKTFAKAASSVPSGGIVYYETQGGAVDCTQAQEQCYVEDSNAPSVNANNTMIEFRPRTAGNATISRTANGAWVARAHIVSFEGPGLTFDDSKISTYAAGSTNYELVVSNASVIDPNGTTGPAYGYTVPEKPQQPWGTTNNTGDAYWGEVNYVGVIPNGPKLRRNVTQAIGWDSLAIGTQPAFFNVVSTHPAEFKERISTPHYPAVTNVAFAGGVTTVTLQSDAALGSGGTNAINQRTNFNYSIASIPSSTTFTVSGDQTANILIGDTFFLYVVAHADWFQFEQLSAGTFDNVYLQRYVATGIKMQPLLGQSGQVPTPSTTVSTSGSTLTVSGSGAAFYPYDFVHLCSIGGSACTGVVGSLQHQYNMIGVTTRNQSQQGAVHTTWDLDRSYTANYNGGGGNVDVPAGAHWSQARSARSVACVDCYLLGDPGEFAQPQNGFVHVAWIQSTVDKSSWFNRNEASAFGWRSVGFFDDIFNGINATNKGMSSDGGDCTGYFPLVGMTADNNQFGVGPVCGTNGTTGQVTFDASGHPTAGLTKTVLGTVGNPNVADGTPLFPWDADGNAITSTALIGALQPVGAQWDTLKVGGGGWVTGIDVAADGTKVTRTDTYGGYYWTGSAWTQLVTKSSMPGADFGFDVNGDSLSGGGIYEIAIAPSNTSHFYMIYNGYVFSSTNHGATWTRASPAQQTDLDPNSTHRWYAPRLAVDPNNENIVYAGEATHGLFKSSNAGSSWSSVGSVAASNDDRGISIAFDPSSTHPGNVTQGIYACSNNTGVYHSTDGGTTWTLTTGTPTSCQDMVVTSAGVVYVTATGQTHALQKYTGSWAAVDTNGGTNDGRGQSIALNGSNIYVMSDGGGTGGGLTVSTNNGSTWTGYSFTDTQSASDVPWLGVTNNKYMTTGRIRYDANSSRLYFSEGIGVYYTASPGSPSAWISQTAGIENMVGVKLVSSPGGSLNTVEYDRPTFHITDPTVYPSTQGPNNNSTGSSAVLAGWDEDYATTNTSYLALYANWQGNDVSAYSNNGGSTWTLFPSHPNLTGTSTGEGSIAVSTPTNSVIAQGFGTAGGGTAGTIYYTTNNGTSWNIATVAGGNGGWGGAGNILLNRHVVCADRVTSGTFYAYGGTTKGVYKSTDGGINWSRVHTGALNIFDGFNTIMRCVPGNAGHLFWTGGNVGGSTSGSFYRSTDGGATWTALPNVLEVYAFGFGAPSTPGAYPAVYIFGWVSGTPGIYRSDNADQATPTWTQLGSDAFPLGSNDLITWVEGDANTFNRAYVSFRGSSFAYWH